MVQHNDKWKKKATREYQKKHGILPATRGRGRGIIDEEPGQEVTPKDVPKQDEQVLQRETDSESDTQETEVPQARSKYARRKVESNSWRFESEDPDPYLGLMLRPSKTNESN